MNGREFGLRGRNILGLNICRGYHENQAVTWTETKVSFLLFYKGN